MTSKMNCHFAILLIALTGVAAEPKLATEEGNMLVKMEPGKTFSVQCPDTGDGAYDEGVAAGTTACQDGCDTAAAEAAASATAASAAATKAAEAAAATKGEDDATIAAQAETIAKTKEALEAKSASNAACTTKLAACADVALGSWHGHDGRDGVASAGGNRQLKIVGRNLGQYYDPLDKNMLTVNFTHTGPSRTDPPSASFQAVADVMKGVEDGIPHYYIQADVVEVEEDHEFSITVDYTGTAPAWTLPFVGKEGADALELKSVWHTAISTNSGIIIHGGGLNPSTKYLCVLEDADGHTEDLVGVVNSPEEIECGKAPSGFKIEDDGPVSIVTVTLVYKANDDLVSFVGEESGQTIELDTCLNEDKDGTETDKDCGGHCGPCDVGSDCKKDSDCERKCIDDVCTNAAECKDLTFKKPGVFAVVFDGDDDESEVFCMGEGQLENGGPDTGGWTLLATSQPRSNAGEWAWNNRGRVVDKSTFGSVSRNRKEFKSVAYGKLVVKDLMFYLWNQGSGDKEFRSYSVHKLNGDPGTIAEIILSYGGVDANYCWAADGKAGFKQTAGPGKRGKMCDTDLYFNSYDEDGNHGCRHNNDAFGPHWNGGDNNGCPFDDPGGFTSFFGLEPGNRYRSLGWSAAANGWNHNSGNFGGDSYIQMYGRG